MSSLHGPANQMLMTWSRVGQLSVARGDGMTRTRRGSESHHAPHSASTLMFWVVSAVSEGIVAGSPMSSVRLWLAESYRRREEEVRARGAVAIVTGPDVGLPPMTDEKVRDVAAGLAVEAALPLLAAFALVMGSVPHRDHAELRAEQVRAARELLPPPYRQRAHRLPRSRAP